MTDAQGAAGRDRPHTPDPDATPVRGVPVVQPQGPVPAGRPAPTGTGPAAPGPGGGQPFPVPGPGGANPFAPPGAPASSGWPGPSAGPAHAGAPAGVPGAAPGTPGTPATPRRRNRAVAWTAAGVAAALVLVGGGFGVAHLVGRDDAGAPGSGDAEVVAVGDPEFDDVLLDVEPTHRFELPVEWQLEELADAPTTDDVARVFADPRLTVPATDAVVYVSHDGRIVVSPPDYALPVTVPDFEDRFAAGKQLELNAAGEWGVHDQYYIAEYRDRTTGEPLAEPRVTTFTVDDDRSAVQFSVRVDEEGVGRFSWDAVDGADQYYVVRADDFGVAVIGSTTRTSWTTVEQDQDVQEALAAENTLDREIIGMNRHFEVALFGDDDAVDGFTNRGADSVPGFGVVAVTDGEIGPLAVQPGGELVQRLPASVAFNAAEEMGVTPGDVDTVDQLPTSYPVSLADGSTVVRPLTYDADGITESEVLTGTEDDAGNVTLTGRRIDYRVPYRVVGSLFTGSYTVQAPDAATAHAGVEAADERATAARARTGEEQPYKYVAAGQGEPGDDASISRTAPEVPYPVHGSTPLATYLAANLVDGQRYVDVSAYIAPGSTVTTTGVSLWDAFEEAVSQNPMALVVGRIEVGYSADRQLLSIAYTGWDTEEERVAEQEAVAAEVERVVGEIVTDGMSEQERAVAINDYLTAHAEYDYAALESRDDPSRPPRAWVATGVLLDGRGVCASYAQAYRALADAAGLEAVYVTGTATWSGERHAWNKVRVDGAWRVVDATWNDSDTDPDAFLLQTDEQAAADRTEDAGWVLDSRVAEYAAR